MRTVKLTDLELRAIIHAAGQSLLGDDDGRLGSMAGNKKLLAAADRAFEKLRAARKGGR